MPDAIALVKDVHKHYQDGQNEIRALNGVSLEISRGEFMAFAGPSGSGKTTALNLLGCLDVPTSGDIYIEGESTAQKSKAQLSQYRRLRLGFIFQSYNLIPVLSAFENVEFPLLLTNQLSGKERKARVEKYLERVGLKTMMHRRPGELSGGQQQRVAVARALVKEPALILADEPTANLDSKTGQEVLELMKELNRQTGATFVFSTHDALVMKYASRVIKLHDGQIETRRA